MGRCWITVDLEHDCPPFLESTRGMTEGLPRLLELFERRRVAATFFCTGAMAERFPHAIAQVVAAGHELGCHGHSHTRFSALDRSAAAAELSRACQVLRSFAPVSSFRAPNLDFPDHYFDLLEAEGITVDSSRGKYKPPYRARPVATRVIRIAASLPPSWLRLPAALRDPLLKRLADPVVLFVHPWEFVDLRQARLPLDCKFNTGALALKRMDEVLALLGTREFQLMRALAS